MASKIILCPFCFEKFNNTDALYQCENDDTNADGSQRCERVSYPEYNQYWGLNDFIHYTWPQKSGLMLRLMGPKLKEVRCPQCGYRSLRFVCPHCYNCIPEEMVKNGGQIISVIGSPSSGKTNYIISLIHELQENGHKVDLQVQPSQTHRDGDRLDSTQNRFTNFENKLFEKRRVLDKTEVDTTDNPWIFRLSQRYTNQEIYLVFYDTAGERFNENLKNQVKYLRESSGIILLLDTLGISHVSDVLEKEGLENLGGKVRDGLLNIFTAIGNLSKDIRENLYSKPAAIVMSKFDAVLDHSDKLEFNTDEFKRGNRRVGSSYLETGKVDFDKIDAISQAIETALLGPWESGKLVQAAREWTSQKNRSLPFAQQDMNDPDNNYKFFGVSALGGMPDDTLQLSKVAPYRVMDPLLWVLRKLGQFNIPSK
ncbi:MAG: hypothetical protein K2L11_01870 [Muribaculaceae bacterium]|nr:hypothetical protein [Muribaculaceae bacterium]